MFKAGDKVRCVDPGHNMYIKRGEEYVVASTSYDGKLVRLEGITWAYYEVELFKPVQEPDGEKAAVTSSLPVDSATRKEYPMAEGLLYYFPAALAAVAHVSYLGNHKHNPGEPLHHSRGKSMDHEDCIVRHSVDARESSGEARTEHMANRAWRALAALQEHLESLGAPMAPNARVDK